jgi:hypothetical protein
MPRRGGGEGHPGAASSRRAPGGGKGRRPSGRGRERERSSITVTVEPSGQEPVWVSPRGPQGAAEFGHGWRGRPARRPSHPTTAASGPPARGARLRVDPSSNPSVRPDRSSVPAAVPVRDRPPTGGGVSVGSRTAGPSVGRWYTQPRADQAAGPPPAGPKTPPDFPASPRHALVPRNQVT